jgi:Tfp pilus assembly protein PilV
VIRSERGMSMVEILVAVFVITVGLVAVATGMQLATAGVATGQQQTTAVFLAEHQLERIKGFAVSTNSAQGWANVTTANFPAAEAYGAITNYTRYRRTTTITDSTATTKRIAVSVFWVPVAVASTNAERSVTLTVVLTSRE